MSGAFTRIGLATLASTLVAGIGLAACTDRISRVGRGQVTHLYTQEEFSYAGGGRDLTTIVYGNPFASLEQETFNDAVTDAMQGRHFGPTTNFTARPDETARPLYRVILAFNPITPVSSAGLCAGTPVNPAPPTEDQVNVQAAFCRGRGMMTGVTGYVGEVTAPGDSAFQRLMTDITMTLFPPDEMDRFDRDDDCALPFGQC